MPRIQKKPTPPPAPTPQAPNQRHDFFDEEGDFRGKAVAVALTVGSIATVALAIHLHHTWLPPTSKDSNERILKTAVAFAPMGISLIILLAFFKILNEYNQFIGRHPNA